MARKTHKELLEEIMMKVKKKEEMELELKERIRQIEEKKKLVNNSKVEEPEVIGYLNREKKKAKGFYGVVTANNNEEKSENE